MKLEVEVQLSTNSLTILKNFANINSGIVFKEGNKFQTISQAENILAIAEVDDVIEKEFGIYELSLFLSLISVHKDGSELTFDDHHAYITDKTGRSVFKYRFCDPSMIKTPPDKNINMGEPEINFKLTSEDFLWIMKAASLLSSPHIAIYSDGGIMGIRTFDIDNDAANTNSLKLGPIDSQHRFEMIFNAENFIKILPGNYNVSISARGVSKFECTDIKLTYYVAVEKDSFYE